MAFAKSYVGDTKALNVVLQTIAKKNAIIPGVTVKPELAGLVQANVAEFYYDLAPEVGLAQAGGDFARTNVGSQKAVITLEAALHIDEKIPNVAIETVQYDVVMDKMAKGTIALVNKMGDYFIEDLVSQATAKEYPFGSDMYEALVEGIKEFSVANAATGIQPTTIIVGDKARAELMKTAAFQRLIGDSAMEIPGLIGEAFGLKVVYSQHLDTVSNAPDFILLNFEGVAFPYSLNSLRVVEDPNFFGVRVQGEIAFAGTVSNGTRTRDNDILPIKTHACKFVVGEEE
jgi:hypothetical protein